MVTVVPDYIQTRLPGQEISPSQRPPPDNTQHLQETDNHTPSGIRTRSPNKQAARRPTPKTARPPGCVP